MYTEGAHKICKNLPTEQRVLTTGSLTQQNVNTSTKLDIQYHNIITRQVWYDIECPISS